MSVDKLITYFDKFDSMLNNGVSIRSQVEADSSITKARQQRLNHKPFTYYIKLRSDRSTKAVIRIFLGPKYDKFGNEYDLKDNYMNFVEMDQFMIDGECIFYLSFETGNVYSGVKVSTLVPEGSSTCHQIYRYSY